MPPMLLQVLPVLVVALLPTPPDFTKGADGGATEGQVVQSPPGVRGVRIAILPDRTTGRPWGLPYLDAAVEDLNRLKPDAVFCVGDLVQGYMRRPEVWQADMADYLKRVGGLSMPWYPTAGNHDVISGTRDPSDRRFAELYRRVVGPLWYSVDLDGLTAIVLFSDENLDDRTITLGEEQLAWLTAELNRAKQRHVPSVLLMHRPLWRYKSAEWSTRVEPLLRPAGTKAVIAGHFHAMQRDPDVDGVQYHILGTCGGAIDQHPLAGQLQHLSVLDLGQDQLELWHLFAGASLPGDFVVAEDQERCFTLKRDDRSVTVQGALPEPGAAGFHGAPLRVVVSNPLKIPVEAAVSIRDGSREEWLVPGEPSLSRTPADTLCPSVTDLQTPVTLRATAPVTVAPGGSGELALLLDCPPQDHSLRAPELTVQLSFIDTKGRTVPVAVRRRLPVQRALAVAAVDGAPAPAIPMEEWNWTPYATAEAPPMVRGERTTDGLVLSVSVPDDAFATPTDTMDQRRDRGTNPMVDALAVRIHAGGAPRQWTWEPSTGHVTGPAPAPRFLRVTDDAGWGARCTIPPSLLKGCTGVNLGVADNDDAFHTQWRWLSPDAFPATIGANTP